MHAEAYAGFGWALEQTGIDPLVDWKILDIGGQNVNGTVHDYFPNATILTLDLENADIIADARTWEPTEQFEIVIATEVFEHVEDWPAIIATARKALVDTGVLLTTCASTGRKIHGATGARKPAPGEWYGNVDPDELADELINHFSACEVRFQEKPGDAYAWAIV